MRLMILLALLLVSGSLSAQTQGAIKRVCHVSRFELAVACIKKYEGLHGPKHHPYVGYGHKLLPGERFSPKMTERQADALLRPDLRKLCAMFRGFGRDSLLLAAQPWRKPDARSMDKPYSSFTRISLMDVPFWYAISFFKTFVRRSCIHFSEMSMR